MSPAIGANARIAEAVGRHHVEQDDPIELLLLATRPHQPAAIEQRLGQPPAEKTGTAGDDDLHGAHLPSPISVFIQPRPSSVPARGRYSQPTQPS